MPQSATDRKQAEKQAAATRKSAKKSSTATATKSAPKKKPTPKKKAPPPSSSAKKSPKPPTPPESNGRPIKYEQMKARIDFLDGGTAKKLLGWQEPVGEQSFGGEYLFRDRLDQTIRCTNNHSNRPFKPTLANLWMSEILSGNWNGDGGESNAETIAIGKTGMVVDGQHRLVGLVWACQEYEKDPSNFPYWNEPPKIHQIIVFGVREKKELINTIGTGKPRSLADAIFASGVFSNLDSGKVADRKLMEILSKILQYAISTVWERTGQGMLAFTPHKRTHAESLTFVDTHPKILQCVRHIHEEDAGESRIGKYLRPGYAAGLLYLMGSSATEAETDDNKGYQQVDEAQRTEKLLDWSEWDKAQDFWAKLAGGADELQAYRELAAEMSRDEEGTTVAEQIALAVKTWGLYADSKPITRDAITLEYVEKDEVQVLAETPLCGGIDLGDGASD